MRADGWWCARARRASAAPFASRVTAMVEWGGVRGVGRASARARARGGAGRS